MLQRGYTVTSQSLPVIQGAYQTLISGQTEEMWYGPTTEWPFISPRPAVIILATDPPVDDWLKFCRLMYEWRHQRGATSSITEGAMCPAYQSIIGMGHAAVPLIVSQLESEGDQPDQWFWALKAITGMDPVRDEDRGDYAAMARSWLSEAARHDYDW